MDFVTLLQSVPLLATLVKSALPAAVGAGFGAGQWLAALPPCRDHSFESATYLVCEADPKHYSIELFWKDPDGKFYQSLHNLRNAQQAAGRTMLFGINAGMYHPNLAPVGLYVERGQQIASAKTGTGTGNFSMQPNGIFYLGGGKAGVRATKDYLKRPPQVDYATQSGPMLVIDGKLHPKFQAGSTSRKIRDGVGVRADGVAVFAISNDVVTFHEFARLFRDELGCPNALFLDGSISSLYAPAIGRNDDFWNLGPMIGVFRRGR
ncbi:MULTISPECIES: phosphodiester glycosidase family protein [unclassified Mesorhizobium]|uniref:phosphodiester glycosidase family protein n=1 Tax=unclassified Mesorhizobium TaxID=325217 RepID=UPI000FCBBD2D|nr:MULTISPECIES: phosphodiester glycosidase family protein [unclassified Mesorhizobium]TGP26529.1 phosphodiester glycosidase family protein [Mesorhizobium sp. M1D.F.Ca.ET.231.01.1.1]TGP38487.1 phosphodiester glycosidase family protein [Mesorhizobium sp. M1D.F.Ca.ET.234.01.1.1]TGS50697.1 phosphodiester glycosidase family protein [Mesorhizobium sp. M1D.F.Ca.ET.184.01.1.1]TGS66582.1 phosphodiester glycosidase family protein [Mesorhizobium sp. M1D.F.Ca.ET.183.01.1.1]